MGMGYFSVPCDGVVFMDFDLNGHIPDNEWTGYYLNGKFQSTGKHAISFEVIKGTSISSGWGYCTFVPYKKRQ